MNIEITIVSIFDILSISTAFTLGLLFITSKSKNNKANIFLGLFLWSLSTEVFTSFIDGQEIDVSIIYSGSITISLLFLYVIKTLNHRYETWHILLITPLLDELTDIIPFFLFFTFNIFLLLYTFNILIKHLKNLEDFYSNIENRTLSWIKNIICIYLFFHSFWVIEDLIGLKFEFVTEYFAIVSTILTFIMIYWIGYNGFTQPEIFNTSILTSDEKKLPELAKKNKETVETFNHFTKKIKDNKLFLQKDITIVNLSKQLEINEKELSKLIKIHTKKNFYHFINRFRIEEFKRLLHTEKANRLSLLGLAKKSGFQSKSTFYSVFKANEGITPKQYQNQLNKSE
ncbi:helix-turn-helix domain-containing protein [Tenacibaculum sp. 190524A02b]|uniref:helix-turn-helix domain-containing protein n=1 Tax=Tenacibaculum vairaonense TaxID=3137860 RepID=UPI0031FB50A2